MNNLAGTIGANYRNYTVLSKVVKDVNDPSKAITASLKTMQEAQKAIMLSLNTVETNRTGVNSNAPAAAYGDMGQRVLSKGFGESFGSPGSDE